MASDIAERVRSQLELPPGLVDVTLIPAASDSSSEASRRAFSPTSQAEAGSALSPSPALLA
eukprot:817267-Rhodomonas_salina.1